MMYLAASVLLLVSVQESESACAEQQCQHSCLQRAGGEEEVCACHHGYLLNSTDLKSCFVYNPLLLVSQYSNFSTVHLDDPEFRDVTLSFANLYASGLDIDSETDSIFWTDIRHNTINTARTDGSEQRVLIDSDLTTPNGLSVDWINRKLYWTNDDIVNDTVEMANLDGSNRSVVVFGDMQQPIDVVVHPVARFLFWSDIKKGGSKIERANLDGSQRMSIVARGLGHPTGLAVDMELDRLYWCNAHRRSKIEFAALDGSGRTVLLQKSRSYPFGLALHGEHLYWTDRRKRTISSVNKTSGQDRVLMSVSKGAEVVLMDVEVASSKPSKPDASPDSSPPSPTDISVVSSDRDSNDPPALAAADAVVKFDEFDRNVTIKSVSQLTPTEDPKQSISDPFGSGLRPCNQKIHYFFLKTTVVVVLVIFIIGMILLPLLYLMRCFNRYKYSEVVE